MVVRGLVKKGNTEEAFFEQYKSKHWIRVVTVSNFSIFNYAKEKMPI